MSQTERIHALLIPTAGIIPRVTRASQPRLGLKTARRGINLTTSPLFLQRPALAAALDPTTISRAKLGDIDAFTAIVEAYHPRCMRFARAMLRNPDDAEDMVQETFVRLYRALPRYEERQRFES